MTLEKRLANAIELNKKDNIEYIFEDIFNNYASLVAFIIYKYIDREEDVEEIVNETFLKFYRACFKEKINNIKAYLVKIAKNSSLDHLRKVKDNIIYDDEIVARVKDDDNSYFMIIDFMKEYLSDEEINIIILHDVYCYTFEDISKSLNIPISSIKSKYYRALKKVKRNN